MSSVGFYNEFSSPCQGPFQHVENVPYPAYTPEYETFDIPGLGDKYEDCGKVFKVWFCVGCGYKKSIKNLVSTGYREKRKGVFYGFC